MTFAQSFIPYAIFLAASLTSAHGSDSPNIITILIDDLGWNDVGFHGSDQISTPNIDALAYSGIILNRHYVLPSCTPSRASLLTGLYPIRTGMQGYPMKCGVRRGIPLSVKLKPQYFKDLGYRTHLVGKWHLGYYTSEFVPNERGFDTFFGYYNGYMEYFTHGIKQDFELNNVTRSFYGLDMHFNHDVDSKWKGRYATHVFTDRARKIIREHDNSEPLYLLVSHLGVHTGIEKGTGLEVPEEVDVDESYPHIKDRPRRELAGMLEEVDKSVGAVVEALQQKGMLENSIILLLSDNGGHTVSTDMDPNWSSNWPLRGMKFTMFEGGVRGVAVIWSRQLPKGIVSEQFLHISDWLPTLYHAAGGNVSDLQNMDGMNQWNALKDMTSIKRGHILLNIDEIEGDEAVIINNRWKVKKGGLRRYGNYDYHWGKEENVATPRINYGSRVRKSTAGRVISNIKSYEESFMRTSITDLRNKSTVQCNFDKDTTESKNGFVSESVQFLCTNYCVFDIVDDPCELTKLDNEDIRKKGQNILNSYKATLRAQEDNSVDPLSDPKYRNGAWMPWLPTSRFFSF